jgi:serine/threonine-protein phosphatase 6 regulatory ankyrin repeat subunit B
LKGYLEIVKLLIKHKVNIDQTDIDGYTPLYVTAAEGCLKIAKLLIEHKVNVNQVTTDEGVTPLHRAVDEGHLKIARLLIKSHADVNQATRDGCTSLYSAAYKGHQNLAKLLIEHNTDVNLKTKKEKTALDIASERGHIDLVELLKQRKRLDSKYIENLCDACVRGDIKQVKSWIDIGVDVNTNFKDTNGVEGTPVYYTANEGHLDIIQLLLQAGANINQMTTDNGYTPLYVTAGKGYVELARILIKAGANINQGNKYGATPLHIAALNKKFEITKLLWCKY